MATAIHSPSGDQKAASTDFSRPMRRLSPDRRTSLLVLVAREWT
jgi:hypothetical protein